MTSRGNMGIANAFAPIFEEHALHTAIAQQVAVTLLSRTTQGCQVDIPQQLEIGRTRPN